MKLHLFWPSKKYFLYLAKGLSNVEIMMSTEVMIVNVILVVLNAAYLYLIFISGDSNVPEWTQKFVIERDTFEHWNATL